MTKYINVCDDETQEVSAPILTVHPVAQRSLGPAVNVPHSQRTRKCVKLFNVLSNSQEIEDRYVKPYGDTEPSRGFWDPQYLLGDEEKVAKTSGKTKAPAKSKAAPAKRKPPAKQKQKQSLVMSDIESDGDDMDLASSAQRHRAQYGSASGDDSEGQGDNINSEERSEDEDSDLGSLKDFLADGSSPRKTRMAGSSTTPPPTTAPVEKSFFVPTQLTGNQSSDDEMPDVQTLIEKKLKRVSKPPIDLVSDSGEGEDEADGPVQPQRKKKQRAVVESDSDE
jgi:ATP-dependent DNA helicase MPH1